MLHMDSIFHCLKAIEELLLCGLCKEGIKTPVILASCSHNFCSICIRRYFFIKQECLICGEDSSPGSLIPNRVMETLCKSFRELRLLIENLKIASFNESDEGFKGNSTNKSPSIQTDKGIPNDGSNKLLRADTCHDIIESTPDFSLGLKEFCSQSQGFSLSTRHLNENSVEMFSNFSVEQNSIPKIVESENSPPLINKFIESKLVKASCPVCGNEVNGSKINAHLDNCLAREEKKKSLRLNTPKRQQKKNPLANKLAYDLLNLRELRSKLKEIGLSTKGSKKELIWRHKEFLAKYNAEQDKLKPRSLSPILMEVEQKKKERQKCDGKEKQLERKRKLFESGNKAKQEDDRKRYLRSNAESYKNPKNNARKTLPAKERFKDLSKSRARKKVSLATNDQTVSVDIENEPLSNSTNCLQLSGKVEDYVSPESPDLYVGHTPSEINLHAAVEADSQASEIKHLIDASFN